MSIEFIGSYKSDLDLLSPVEIIKFVKDNLSESLVE